MFGYKAVSRWGVLLGIVVGVWLCSWGCSVPVVPSGETGQEVDTGKETSSEDPKEAAQEVVQEVAQDAGGETAQEKSAEVAQEPQTELVQDSGNEAIPEVTESASESTGDVDPKEISPDQKVGKIAIYMKGDLTPQTFTDGLSGQTPQNYQVALSRYEVLTSQNDTNPQLCFDHGKNAVIADMAKDNLMGSCLTQSLKTALYTYGRVKVEWVSYEVDGTVHASGQVLSGKLTIFRAFSTGTHQGRSYQAGDAVVRFMGFEFPIVAPPPISIPAIDFALVNGEFFVTFPYKRGLLVDGQDKEERWARFNWKIFEAFRWEERTTAGYVKGRWDVGMTPQDTETVKIYGVTDYYITTSMD